MNIMLLGRTAFFGSAIIEAGTQSIIASAGASAAGSMQAIFNTAYDSAIASGMSDADAKAAAGAAVRNQGAPVIANADARIAQAKAEAQTREYQRLLAINAEQLRNTQVTAYNAAQSSNVEAREDSPISFIPIALGVSAIAYFMFKH